MKSIRLLKTFKTPSFSFFSFFRKSESKLDITKKETTHEDYLDYYRQNPHKIQKPPTSKVQEIYKELRKEREEKEREKEENLRKIEEASKRAKREHEVTLETFDHRSIMLNNINILPSEDFRHIDEFVYYFNEICHTRVRLSEENTLKIIRGFQTYADKLSAEQIDTPMFNYFLDTLRREIALFKEETAILEVLKFMDLYCVDYPELWVKLDKQFRKYCKFWSLNIIIELTCSFSNQDQGSDQLYDLVEKRILNYMDNLTSEEQLMALKSFFNVKRGTRDFIGKLLKRLSLHLDDEEFSFELDYLLNIALVMEYLGEEFLTLKGELFEIIEERIIERKEELDLAYSAAFARCFGLDYGSEKLFYVLELMASENIGKFTLEEYRLYTEGLVFTYRISDKHLDSLLEQFSSFKSSLSPTFLSKLSKSLHILEKDKHKVVKDIEGALIGIMRNNPQMISKEDAYQMAFCYSLTRNGSREFYKLLEMILANRLNEWVTDGPFIARLYRIYEKSGLCSHQFLTCLNELRGVD